MTRSVRRKVGRKGIAKVDSPTHLEIDNENVRVDEEELVDWTKLHGDPVIQLFSLLNYRDRASLSSTCRTWRTIGRTPCLWQSMDLRTYKCDATSATSLASRCGNLQKLRFRGVESAVALMNLQARNLREISGDHCQNITDCTLSMIVARHADLESLELGPHFCELISSEAIKSIAVCCRQLRKLRLSGITEVDGDSINALANNCRNLTEIGFIDCLKIDEKSLGKIISLRFLSVAGTSIINWVPVSEIWSKMPNLKGLDVSRTGISPHVVTTLFSSSKSLKVISAFYCLSLLGAVNFIAHNNLNKGKLLLAPYTDIFKGVASLFDDTIMEERTIFSDWRNLNNEDENLNEIMTWLEWALSHSLLHIAERNPTTMNSFWVSQGTVILAGLMQSSQEDVQERAASCIASFVVTEEENTAINSGRAEAVMRDGGIQLLLQLARSWREGFQFEAAKAIANLSVNTNAAKAVVENGGINILTNLTSSMNKLVAEEAAVGLWNLSFGEDHKAAIAEAGAIKALVDLIFKWSTGGDGVLEKAAAGALANLAGNEKCSVVVAGVGGVQALVMLARTCKHTGAQEQAVRALANLASHGDSNTNNTAVGQEPGALETLVHFTRSFHDGVRQEAARAIWNLTFDEQNRVALAAAGGIEALVDLARSCANAAPGLQERVAGALWGISMTETNSIAIRERGGIAPLIKLARSEATDVHETATGALWNLAYNPGNALQIVEDGGVSALVLVCSTSVSKMARFMASLALTFIFDGRMDEYIIRTSKGLTFEGSKTFALKYIDAFIHTFSDPTAFSAAAVSSLPAALSQVKQLACIPEAGHLRCSGAEIGRFMVMLRNPSAVLKTCAAFALVQFTASGGRNVAHHLSLVRDAGGPRVLRAAAAATSAPIEAKIFARIALRNLEHNHMETKV